MLVLRRKINESVVMGDEVKVTVEDVCGSDDGQRLFGATVRLGFESPQYVTICRSELLKKRSGGVRTGGPAKQSQPRMGKLVEIPDAQARLRIEVPQKIPVCCNGTLSIESNSEERLDGDTRTSKAVHHVTCHKDDRITICSNIVIATLAVQRFVSHEHTS
ncbi:MAG: carbon storage regulator [Planctomycetes bacterium]|nr:carbon storage regulator [Planctomycetota bacterium]